MQTALGPLPAGIKYQKEPKCSSHMPTARISIRFWATGTK